MHMKQFPDGAIHQAHTVGAKELQMVVLLLVQKDKHMQLHHTYK